MVQSALQDALKTGTEMDARAYLETLNLGGSIGVLKVVQYAKQLYPDELDCLAEDRFEDDDDVEAVFQEIVSILMTGYDDDEDEEEEDVEDDEEDEEDEEEDEWSDNSSTSSAEFIPAPKRRRHCLNPISLGNDYED